MNNYNAFYAKIKINFEIMTDLTDNEPPSVAEDLLQ